MDKGIVRIALATSMTLTRSVRTGRSSFGVLGAVLFLCARTASAGHWVSYSGPNYNQVATANTGDWNQFGGFPGPGLMCAVVHSQSNTGRVVHCYTPAGTQQSPTFNGPFTIDFGSSSPFVDGVNIIKSMAMSGSSSGYSVYALGSDGKVYRTTIGLPVSAATIAQTWTLFANPSPGVTPRQIVYANGSGLAHGLFMVGSDSKVYHLALGLWTKYPSSTAQMSALSLAGSDDGVVLPIFGSTSSSTTFGAPFGRVMAAPPTNAPMGLAYGTSNFLLANSLSADITPVSCDGIKGCYALSPNNLQALGTFSPAIYWSAGGAWQLLSFSNLPASWVPDNTNGGFSTDSGPWSVASGNLFRSSLGASSPDLFFIGSFSRLYEWVPN